MDVTSERHVESSLPHSYLVKWCLSKKGGSKDNSDAGFKSMQATYHVLEPLAKMMYIVYNVILLVLSHGFSIKLRLNLRC